jgi:NTP pyrophosphatase (non-canonical NTP hydrolase)
MGKFKHIGDPFLTLAEEMAEAIQVIMKKYRFNGDWNEVPEGQSLSRIEQLNEEMKDVQFQWNRIVDSFNDDAEYGEWECGESTLHGHNEECNCPDSSQY